MFIILHNVVLNMLNLFLNKKWINNDLGLAHPQSCSSST